MYLVRSLKGTLRLTFITPVQRTKRADPNAKYWSIQDHVWVYEFKGTREPEIAGKLKPGQMMEVELVEKEPEGDKLVLPTGEPPNPEDDFKLKQGNDDSFDDEIPF